MNTGVFKEELLKIKDEKIWDFTTRVLGILPNYLEQDNYVKYIKTVVALLELSVDFLIIESIGKDILISAGLLHDSFEVENGITHAVVVRSLTKKIASDCDLSEEVFDNIMRLIEGHEGGNSLVPQLVNDDLVGVIFAFCTRLGKEKNNLF